MNDENIVLVNALSKFGLKKNNTNIFIIPDKVFIDKN